MRITWMRQKREWRETVTPTTRNILIHSTYTHTHTNTFSLIIFILWIFHLLFRWCNLLETRAHTMIDTSYVILLIWMETNETAVTFHIQSILIVRETFWTERHEHLNSTNRNSHEIRILIFFITFFSYERYCIEWIE